MTGEEVIGKMYEFGREWLDESDLHSNSPRDRWKAAGKRELLGYLFSYLKELDHEETQREK